MDGRDDIPHPHATTEVPDAIADLGTGTTVVANFAVAPEECDELGLAALRKENRELAWSGEALKAPAVGCPTLDGQRRAVAEFLNR